MAYFVPYLPGMKASWFEFGEIQPIDDKDALGNKGGIDFSNLQAEPDPPSLPSIDQIQLMAELEAKRRARQIPIPTADDEVKRYLRILREPICLFGEGPFERRERLGLFLATHQTGEASQRITQLRKQIQAEVRSQAEEATKTRIDDSEEFWVPGPSGLLPFRKWLVDFSLGRARERLVRERAALQVSINEVRESRQETLNLLQGRVQSVACQVGGDRPLSCCDLSVQGLAVTGGMDGSLRLWSIPSCEEVDAGQMGHDGIRVSCVQFAENGSLFLASSGLDGQICLWRRPEQDGEALLAKLSGHTDRVSRLRFHPSQRHLVSSSHDTSWRLWDLGEAGGRKDPLLQLQEGHSHAVTALDCHCDGALVLTGGLDGIGRLWDLRSGKAIWTLQGGSHAKGILAVAFSPSLPTIATGGEEGTIQIWEMRVLKATSTIAAHSSLITSLSFGRANDRFNSHDGILWSAGYDGRVRCWNLWDGGGSLVRSLDEAAGSTKVMDASIRNLNDSNTPTVLTANYDRTFRLWV